jgi:uncharacterized membrane protein YhiD involved in acid resistance
MDEYLRSLALRPVPWTAGEVLLNISVAFLLGLFIAWVYRATQRSLATSFSFVNTLVILSMLMTLVMMVIGNNIARAFGLAGAMSIIRFRTVVKDTRDTAFVFYSLGAGMAAGTGYLKMAVLGTLLIGFFLGVLHWSRHGSVSRNEFLLSFRIFASDDETDRRVFLPVFQNFLRHYSLVSVKSTRMGEVLVLTFHVSLKDPEQSELLVSELSALEGIQGVAISQGDEAQT